MNVRGTPNVRRARAGAALWTLGLLVTPACDRPAEDAGGAPVQEVVDDSPEAKVRRWVADGDWKVAFSAIEHELSQDPANTRWQALAARAEMELGRFEPAGARLLEALAEAPTDPWLNTERAVFEASRNRHDEAIRVLEEVLDEAPDLARAHEHLGRSLEFEALIRMGSRGLDFDVLNRGIAALERSIQLEETPARLLALGKVLERAQRFEDARTVYRRGCDLAPEFPDVWHGLGRVLTELGELDAAHEAFGPALRYDQENAEAWFDYGVLVEEMDLREKARMCYRKALEYDDSFPRAYYRLGLLTTQAGDEAAGDRLIATYQRLQKANEDLQAWRYEARQNPDDPETLFQTGLAFVRAGKPEDGRGWLERAQKLRPTDPRVHFQLGRVHAAAERLPQALGALDEAVRLDPDHLGAHRLRPQVATPQGALDKAAASFEAIARLTPDDADAWFNVGQARRQVDTAERALEAFDRCLGLAPTHRLALEMSARVELGLGRLDDARVRAEALLALEPAHQVATAIVAEIDKRKSQ